MIHHTRMWPVAFFFFSSTWGYISLQDYRTIGRKPSNKSAITTHRTKLFRFPAAGERSDKIRHSPTQPISLLPNRKERAGGIPGICRHRFISMFYFETSRKPDSLLIWRICAAGSPLTTANVILFFPLLLVFPVVTCRSIASMLRPLTLWKLPRQQTGTLHLWKRSFFFYSYPCSLFARRRNWGDENRSADGPVPRSCGRRICGNLFLWRDSPSQRVFSAGFVLEISKKSFP